MPQQAYQLDQTDHGSQHRHSPFAQWQQQHYLQNVIDRQSQLVFVQTSSLAMHMGYLKVQSEQGLVAQLVVVARCYEVFCCLFLVVQAQERHVDAHDLHHLNAILMTRNPTLFRLNVLLLYVHSWLVQSLQGYTKFRNAVFLSVGAEAQSHEHLRFVRGKPTCDAFHSIRMLQFQLEPVLELHHDVHAAQFLLLYA